MSEEGPTGASGDQQAVPFLVTLLIVCAVLLFLRARERLVFLGIPRVPVTVTEARALLAGTDGPEQLMALARRVARPVFCLPVRFSWPVVVVTDLRLAKLVLNSVTADAGGPFAQGLEVHTLGVPSIFSRPSDLAWKCARTGMHNVLKVHDMTTCRELAAERADEWCKTVLDRHIREQRPVDVWEAMSRLATRIAFETLFARRLDEGAIEIFLRDLDTCERAREKRRRSAAGACSAGVWSRRGAAGRRAAAANMALAQDILEEQRMRSAEAGEAAEGALPTLLEAIDRNAGYATDKERCADIVMLAACMLSTTAAAASWVISDLAAAPAVQEHLRRELREVGAGEKTPELAACVTESMRLHPSVFGGSTLMRACAREVALPDGVRIPAGARVAVPLKAILRDPAVVDTDTFRPDRWTQATEGGEDERKQLVFGLGLRQCIARTLATAIVQVIVAVVCRRYRLELLKMPVSRTRLVSEPWGALVRAVPVG